MVDASEIKLPERRRVRFDIEPIVVSIHPIGWDIDPPYFRIGNQEYLKKIALIKADYLIDVNAVQTSILKQIKNLIEETPVKEFG
ncbi:MAG: hypothetical protein ACXACF_01350 [Candidatus Hermodarchaeia archaeon]|jgi:hypothetical protein